MLGVQLLGTIHHWRIDHMKRNHEHEHLSSGCDREVIGVQQAGHYSGASNTYVQSHDTTTAGCRDSTRDDLRAADMIGFCLSVIGQEGPLVPNSWTALYSKCSMMVSMESFFEAVIWQRSRDIVSPRQHKLSLGGKRYRLCNIYALKCSRLTSIEHLSSIAFQISFTLAAHSGT